MIQLLLDRATLKSISECYNENNLLSGLLQIVLVTPRTGIFGPRAGQTAQKTLFADEIELPLTGPFWVHWVQTCNSRRMLSLLIVVLLLNLDSTV